MRKHDVLNCVLWFIQSKPFFLFQLWKFNFATHNWTCLITDGSMPTELASHAGLFTSQIKGK
jgi:hypothetical protein